MNGTKCVWRGGGGGGSGGKLHLRLRMVFLCTLWSAIWSLECDFSFCSEGREGFQVKLIFFVLLGFKKLLWRPPFYKITMRLSDSMHYLSIPAGTACSRTSWDRRYRWFCCICKSMKIDDQEKRCKFFTSANNIFQARQKNRARVFFGWCVMQREIVAHVRCQRCLGRQICTRKPDNSSKIRSE